MNTTRFPFILLSLILALSVTVFGSSKKDESQAQFGSIKVKVIDKATKEPLIGATLSIVGTTTGGFTDVDGFYIFKKIEENIYKMNVNYVGYASLLKTDVRVVREKTTYLEIELAENAVSATGVTVVGSTFQEDKQAPVSKFTYSKEEIYRSPGAAGDIFRAIETLPGVSSGGGEFSAFSVRGGSPRDNITLVDNIPVDNVTHFEGGTEEQDKQGGRFSIFAPNLIEQADFQAGGFPARYGGKNASIVDLKIKEGNRENSTMNGSWDIIGEEFNYDGPSYILPTTGLVLSARHQDFERILKIVGQKDMGNPSFTDIILKTTTAIDANNELNVLGIYSPEKFDRNIDNVFESDHLYSTELYNAIDNKYVFGADLRSLTSNNSVLQSTFYYKQKDRDVLFGRAYTDPINGLTPTKEQTPLRKDIFFQNDKESEIGLKSQFSLSIPDGSMFTSGLELSRTNVDDVQGQNGIDTVYTYDQNDYRPNASQQYLVRLPQYVNASFKDNKFNAALFSEYSYNVSDAFVINPGVRYEYSEFNKKGYVSPRLSASYKMDADTRLNLAGGVYYQSPELRLITSDIANASLDREKSYHIIAGVTKYLTEDLKFTLEAYDKEFDNLLVRRDRTTNVWLNSGKGWARGIDISLVRRFYDNFYGQVNYSYSQSKRDDNDGKGEYNSDFNQPHIFNILFGYEVNKELSFSIKWKYATGRPKDTYIVHSDIFSDPSFVRYSKEIVDHNGDRLPDFHTLNLRVDYRKQLGKYAIVTFIDILNLYNRLNVSEERFMERSGGVDNKGFRITPSIGVKFEM